MNPILISAMFGFLKGYLATGPQALGQTHELTAAFVAPVMEETIYRAIPLYTFGDAFPRGGTALIFAVDHVMGEAKRLGYRPAHLARRFADVLFGGLLYEVAFRQWGILGAVAAHSAHNLMCSAGYRARQRTMPRSPAPP